MIVLDVREMPPRERHTVIFDIFDELPLNGMLQLINDHDPKPLYYQFQAELQGVLSKRGRTPGLSTLPG